MLGAKSIQSKKDSQSNAHCSAAAMIKNGTLRMSAEASTNLIMCVNHFLRNDKHSHENLKWINKIKLYANCLPCAGPLKIRNALKG